MILLNCLGFWPHWVISFVISSSSLKKCHVSWSWLYGDDVAAPIRRHDVEWSSIVIFAFVLTVSQFSKTFRNEQSFQIFLEMIRKQLYIKFQSLMSAIWVSDLSLDRLLMKTVIILSMIRQKWTLTRQNLCCPNYHYQRSCEIHIALVLGQS